MGHPRFGWATSPGSAKPGYVPSVPYFLLRPPLTFSPYFLITFWGTGVAFPNVFVKVGDCYGRASE
jgi:hypothetical protein